MWLLKKGEANLPRHSLVNVSQLFTVDKRDLVEKIGSPFPSADSAHSSRAFGS